MLAELSEADASGELAQIYAEIRTLCAVPYVSSLQRHLATRPGWLEWGWQSARSVFVAGIAQEAGWRAAEQPLGIALPPVPASVRRVWGMSDEDARRARDTAALFVRVSPTNLMLSAMLRKLLAGAQPTGTATGSTWTPPAQLPEAPKMVDVEHLNAPERENLMAFGTVVAGQPFVPGLYRMLANWPGFFAYLTTVLAPLLNDPQAEAACAQVQQAVDAAADEVFAQLAPVVEATWPMPPQAEHADVLDAVERYRVTSPQMIVFGRMIRDSLNG